jgi:mannose-6-phosphate isomerase-like protein (cupin superfamily)
MKNNQNNIGISRRESVKQLTLVSAIIGLAINPFNAAAITAADISPMLKPFYLPPLPPLLPGPGGLDIRTWVRSSQTNKQFSCVETAVSPRKMGPAPHVHAQLDELMLVLDGTATVWMDGKTEEVAAGGWHLRPRKIEHTFWNASDKPLRFIDMYFNQNFEDFLEELFHQIIPKMINNHLTPTDPGIATQMADLDARFGVTTFAEKRQPLIEKFGLNP